MRHPATRFFSASMFAHNRKVTTAQDNDADRETPWIIFRYKKNHLTRNPKKRTNLFIILELCT